MTRSRDTTKTIIRNKLLGRWAADKLGLSGSEADAYADALAAAALDPTRGDVFSSIRKAFDMAGVAQSDEQILRVMTELMIKAGNQLPTRGGSVDAASVVLARNLIVR